MHGLYAVWPQKRSENLRDQECLYLVVMRLIQIVTNEGLGS